MYLGGGTDRVCCKATWGDVKEKAELLVWANGIKSDHLLGWENWR
jgi:hypothetical protein